MLTISNKLTTKDHEMLSISMEGDFVTLFGSVVFQVLEKERSEDKDAIYIEYILQIQGEERFFSCSVVLIRYGYDDYGYEGFSQDLDFIEVEKKEVVTYTWVQKT
jgi:hypothetical protein